MDNDRNSEKRKPTNIWDIVAPSFGKIGPKYWNIFGERLVELSNIEEGGLLLDIGMGRGASLFPAAKKIGNNGKVIGIDFSERMVHETERELLERNIENAEVYMIDVEEMSFDEQTFDYIISGFFITHLFYFESKLSNITKILKKGGKFSFTTWGEQKDQKWLTQIIDKYIDKNTSTEIRYNTVDCIVNELKESDFHTIRVHEEQPYVIYNNQDAWWKEMYSNAFRGIIEEIKVQGMNRLESFKADVNEGLKKFTREDGIYFKMPVIYAFCKK
ncbi:MAG: methyltransferase domain-containing protein [Vallitalea sp.]|jgi:ubiquinone/menaquinone biosynthesis C-methylase UbiE|nr:methyltransferase domain-containing protein [Vallitalea sp.]